MQMEGEFADIRDRSMMALYGADKSKAEMIDHTNSSRFVGKYNKHKDSDVYNDKGVGNEFVSIDVPNTS